MTKLGSELGPDVVTKRTLGLPEMKCLNGEEAVGMERGNGVACGIKV